MKSIILARVSTAEQESNEAQVSRLVDFAKTKGFENPEIQEIKESSTKADRKKFQEVIEQIKKSKEPIALFTDTVDRLQRSFKESVVLEEMRKEGKVELWFYRENLRIHKDSNSADLIRWDMAVMFARSYVLQLSDNVKRVLEQRRRNGEWMNKVCIGYLNVSFGEGENIKKDIIIDPNKGHLIKMIFEMYSTGNYSLSMIKEEMKKQGLKSKGEKELSKSMFETILKNSFYCGIATSKKHQPYPHKHPKLISQELFDKCQEVR